ncbi:MAG: DMT family transporter [Idiomarina sp.]|nr:DMT family transporter [Idiomarina sp.]
MNAERKALLLALTAVLLWSTVATAFKITLNYLTPLQMVMGAALASTLVMGLCAWAQGLQRQLIPAVREDWRFFLLLGAINPSIYYLILFQAYNLLPASQAQPLNYTWAIALAIMAAVFLKQPLQKRDSFACIVGYLGVVVIATQGSLSDWQQTNWWGVGLALLSTFLWAGYWILNTLKQREPVITLFWCFLASLPILIVANVIWSDWSQVPWQGYAAVAYVGVFEMGITFILWLSAMRLTRHTARISTLIFISPFISLMLLAAIIGEAISIATVGGLLLIICGLLVQQWRRKESSPPPIIERSPDEF